MSIYSGARDRSRSPLSKSRDRSSSPIKFTERGIPCGFSQLRVYRLPVTWQCTDFKEFLRDHIDPDLFNEIHYIGKGTCFVVRFSSQEICKLALKQLRDVYYEGEKLGLKTKSWFLREAEDGTRHLQVPGRESAIIRDEILVVKEGTGPIYDTYGLSCDVFNKLHLRLPLNNKIVVKNLCPEVKSGQIREVFELAGNIKKIFIRNDMNGTLTAHIQFEHPLEAVQAVSMFRDQYLFDKPMKVIMDRKPGISKVKLPEGLVSCGPGLGLDGEPMKNIGSMAELLPLKERLEKLIDKAENLLNRPQNQPGNAATQPSVTPTLNPTPNVNSNPFSNPLQALLPGLMQASGVTGAGDWLKSSPQMAGLMANPHLFFQAMAQALFAANMQPTYANTQLSSNVQPPFSGYTNSQPTLNIQPSLDANLQLSSNIQPPCNTDSQRNLNMQPSFDTNLQPLSNMQQPCNTNSQPNLNMQPFFDAKLQPSSSTNSQQSLTLNMQPPYNIQSQSTPNVQQNYANLQPSLSSQPTYNANLQPSLNRQSPHDPNIQPFSVEKLNTQKSADANSQSTVNVQQTSYDAISHTFPNTKSEYNLPSFSVNLNQQSTSTSSYNYLRSNQSKSQSSTDSNRSRYGKEIREEYSDKRKEKREKSKLSTTVIFKRLPSDVNMIDIKRQLRDVGKIKFIEKTGVGEFTVGFRRNKEAEYCVDLYDNSFVNGKNIEVRFKPRE